jgi:uncharacterized membrane protein YebE (DUF533 family)
MFNYKTSIAALAIAALPALAFAQAAPATPRIDQRQANQERRIEQGVRSGELTPHETRKLERGQAKVRRMEARVKADGVVTAQERRQITREQDRQSERIAHEKHDAQHS